MKRFKAHAYLLFILTLNAVLFTGCGTNGETGKWLPDGKAPTTSTTPATPATPATPTTPVAATPAAAPSGTWHAPYVTSTIPANLATGVLVNTTVSATFSEAMIPATINSATFTLYNGLTPVAPGGVTYSGITATFIPGAFLANSTTYTARVTTGAKALSTAALASDYVWTFTTGAAASAIVPGILDPYAIASFGGMTNTNAPGTTRIDGDVVLHTNQTCNSVAVGAGDNFGLCNGGGGDAPPINNAGDQVITSLAPADGTAAAVMAALLAKWNSLSPASMPGATVLGCGTIGSTGDAGALIGCSGNSTLPPGVYSSATGSTIGVGGTLTLDGGGDANAVFVFQAQSALTTAVNSTILLTGGTKASNVWWYVGSSATINGGTTFNGSVAASASISLGTGATSCGRLLAGAEGAGAFTFLNNRVSRPGHASAPAGCN